LTPNIPAPVVDDDINVTCKQWTDKGLKVIAIAIMIKWANRLSSSQNTTD